MRSDSTTRKRSVFGVFYRALSRFRRSRSKKAAKESFLTKGQVKEVVNSRLKVVLGKRLTARINDEVLKLKDEALDRSRCNALIPSDRELIKLRNFSSAEIKLSEYDFQRLNLESKLIYILAAQSFKSGAIADFLLEELLVDMDANANVASLGPLSERIITSTLGYDKKSSSIRSMIDIVSSSQYHKKKAVLHHLNWSKFRIELSDYRNPDVLEYFDSENLNVEDFSFQSKYIPQLIVHGHLDIVKNYLHEIYDKHGVRNAAIASCIFQHYPEFLDDRKIQDELLAIANGNLSLLGSFIEDERIKEQCSYMLDNLIQNQASEFGALNAVKQDALLRVLLKQDRIELAYRLAASSKYRTCLLPFWVCHGFTCLENDDYRGAKDSFEKVLQQDPGDPLASSGLRFAIPRCGFDFSYFSGLRDRIGYGIAAGGRTGVAPVGSENTIALLMQGNYIDGLYSKKYAFHWGLLKSRYGSKFLSFERLPEHKKSKESSIFVVGDEGVGDEVRTAQYYSYLDQNFSRVVVTCDPRLYKLFTKSFPGIDFLPVKRLRKGVSEYIDGEPARLCGFDQKIACLLTEECRIYLDKCDYITFGQNLFFNHFIGAIERPQFGVGYIKPAVDKPVKHDNLKVGLLWRSHFRSRMRDFMYMELVELLPLLGVPGVNYVSLQHSIDEDEVEICNQNDIQLLNDIDLFNDFDTMASKFSELDLVIGISSLPMELAASVGVEVWMLGISPENYYLRSSGGRNPLDRYTLNSTVVATSENRFGEPRNTCVRETVLEARRRLELASLTKSSSTKLVAV